MTDKMKQIVESAKAGALHPLHVHVHPTGKNEFTIHSVGSKVHKSIKHGMKVKSSDLDDFREMGMKVKETKKPISEEAETLDEAAGDHAHIQHVYSSVEHSDGSGGQYTRHDRAQGEKFGDFAKRVHHHISNFHKKHDESGREGPSHDAVKKAIVKAHNGKGDNPYLRPTMKHKGFTYHHGISDTDYSFGVCKEEKLHETAAHGLHGALVSAGFKHHDEGGGHSYYEHSGKGIHHDELAKHLDSHGYTDHHFEYQGGGGHSGVHFHTNRKTKQSASFSLGKKGLVDNLSHGPTEG